jgi:hypothetical protein
MNPKEYNFPTVVRHEYDIDAFEIIDQLKEKYNSNIEQGKEQLKGLESINVNEELLIKFLNEEGVDSSEHKKHRNYIIPSYYNLYNTYLGYKLLTIDLYKIEPLLSYQSVLFLGNYYAVKDNFIGLIEFMVYDFVKAELLPFEQIRLEKIVNWLERNRIFLVNKAYNESFNDPSEAAISKKKGVVIRTVKMDAQFANVFYEKFKCFFGGQDILLFNLIIKNEFTERIVFNGQMNQLAELFKRLNYNNIIDVANLKLLAKWITENFATGNDKVQDKGMFFNTIYAVLKNCKREPPKTKRILVELAKYIKPEDRKKE